jgi:hypothetical protein
MAKHTISLPTELDDRLKTQQGAGQSFSDVIRQRLEQSYLVGTDQMVLTVKISQQVEQMHAEIRQLYEVLDQIIKTLEVMELTPAPEPEAPKAEESLRIVSYEEMYADDPLYNPPSPPTRTDEAFSTPRPPQERKRWWHR